MRLGVTLNLDLATRGAQRREMLAFANVEPTTKRSIVGVECVVFCNFVEEKQRKKKEQRKSNEKKKRKEKAKHHTETARTARPFPSKEVERKRERE